MKSVRALLSRSVQHADTETVDSVLADVASGRYEMLEVVKDRQLVGVVVFRVVQHEKKTVFYVIHLAATEWGPLGDAWDSSVVAEARRRGATSIVGGCRPAAARFFQRKLGAKQKMIVVEQEI